MINIYNEYEPYHENTTMPKCGLKRFWYYSDTLKLANPNDIFAIGISMKRRYAKCFLENGTIKFGSPKKWIEESSKSDPGRADIQEGVFAAYNVEDIEGIRKGLADNPDSYQKRLKSYHSDLVYLVDSKVIELPTYCFYIIRFGDFEIFKRDEKNIAHAHIPSRYFRALGDWKNWEQAQNDNPDDSYIFITVYDDEAFIKRIKAKLKGLGVSDEEFLYRSIDYRDIDVPFKKCVEHPFELFMKNKQFSDQHEGRIVLNIKDEIRRSFFLNNTISVGSLDDICVLDDFYHAGGMDLYIELNKKCKED